METLITTDARGRVTIPGHPNQRFVVRDHEDGSVLLEPAVVVSAAQHAYNNDPDLQRVLHEAMTSPTSTRPRPRRR